MAFLSIIILPALLIWSVIALIRGSIFLTTAFVLVSCVCFPAEFLSFEAMGLTWTLDRLWFLVLVVQVIIQWCRGEHAFVRMEHCDLAIGLLFLWMLLRTITQPLGSVLPQQPPTLMHLINGYAIPFSLYAAVRCTKLEAATLKPAALVLLVLSAYLGITALLEVSQNWSLVFPQFISDPDLGIHFGRARGPMLQSVRLGMCLVTAWVGLTVYSVWLKPDSRSSWVAFAFGSILLFAAIFFTYTRSVWMGAVFAIAMLLVLGLSGFPRRVAVFGLLTSCVMLLCLSGSSLVNFKREYTAAETRESTFMRVAFAYVSVEMFKDRPLVGCGFNQFQVANLPYLADRSTDIRLESIRGYVHHNGFLSILVELGLIGMALYTFVIISLARQIWLLWKAQQVPKWVRGFVLVALAVGGSHMLQMAFHELSFSPIENSIIFAICGLVVAANQQFCLRPEQTDYLNGKVSDTCFESS